MVAASLPSEPRQPPTAMVCLVGLAAMAREMEEVIGNEVRGRS